MEGYSLSSNNLDGALAQLLIQQPEPQIVAIKGSWGTGKTFFWKGFLTAHPEHKSSYVSLFGLASMKELRQAIAASLIPSSKASGKRYILSVLGNLPGLTSRGIGLSADLLTEVFLERSLKTTATVCLDDMERTSIDRGHLLGFANNLRDEYRVNVVLIYSEDQLANDDSYYLFREKVIDRELPFLPDVEEVVKISDPDSAIREDVLRHCRMLNLRNVRVIRRGLQYFREIRDLIADEDPGTMVPQALHSLLLFSYIRFTPDGPVGSLEQLTGYSEMGEEILLHAQEHGSCGAGASNNDTGVDQARAKIEFLHAYGYRETDEFDTILMDFIDRGVPDTLALAAVIKQHADGKHKRAKEENLRHVWDMFNHSFRNNEPQFVEALLAAAEQHIDVITLNDMDNFLWVLGQLGRENEQEKLLRLFSDEHGARIRQWEDTDDFSMIREKKLADTIAQLRAEVSDNRALEAILGTLIGENSWSSRDIARLNQFTVDEFEAYFDGNEGRPLGDHAKGLAKFTRRFANPDEQMVDIERKAIAALKRIAAKSAFNKAKIKRYVDFDD